MLLSVNHQSCAMVNRKCQSCDEMPDAKQTLQKCSRRNVYIHCICLKTTACFFKVPPHVCLSAFITQCHQHNLFCLEWSVYAELHSSLLRDYCNKMFKYWGHKSAVALIWTGEKCIDRYPDSLCKKLASVISVVHKWRLKIWLSHVEVAPRGSLTSFTLWQ